MIWLESAKSRIPSRCVSSSGRISAGPFPREARSKRLFPLKCWPIHPASPSGPSELYQSSGIRRLTPDSRSLEWRRLTAVDADNEVRWKVVRPLRTFGPHTDDTVLCQDQVPNRGTHVELERRALAGLLREHREDRRLGDKAGDEAQRLGCEPGSPPPPLVDVDHVDDSPGELAEPVPELHLVEGVNAARLQSVAAKGSQEVMVALKQRDFHPAAGEQVGESRSRRACTDDDDSSDRHNALPSCLETSTVPARLAEI